MAVLEGMREYERYGLEDPDGRHVGVPYEAYEYGKAHERALREGLRLRRYYYKLVDADISEDYTPKS
jgi:hypothetical protein